RFNTFIIENYLLHIETSDNNTEPVRYFHNVFHKLSTGLGDFGSTIEQLNFPLIQNRVLHLLKNLISESVFTIFLIEKSIDEENIVFNIRSIKSGQLATTIENIQKYGTLFKKKATEIEAEINQFKSDYPDYFDGNGQLKYTPVKLTSEEAFKYLIDNTQIPELRGKFIRAVENHNFINLKQLETLSDKISNLDVDENDLLKKVISSLVIVLLAYSYAEPFFKMPNQTSNDFARHIGTLTFLLAQITN
ncbi:hypothetical protein, partial [Mucilaginibacter sp.]|uniref:hypothetical protein n=1 Tax=Mucilaginibacter sp. TaxID=1882438 RepID=UPI003565A176